MVYATNEKWQKRSGNREGERVLCQQHDEVQLGSRVWVWQCIEEIADRPH